ncbi:hypothetical protein SeMB42_g06407 [Synchytrium endobioticum]|uniref:Uncharacterized protein n=1 Tax=Synchytrium endobioticum TaxID=286115 RepID=A0A507CLT6_9FUNG|nr:hypothetical protein SeMB42_g06407 [Synchytrium endobioticum]
MSATFHMHTNVITDEFYPGRDGIVDRATNQVDSFSISKLAVETTPLESVVRGARDYSSALYLGKAVHYKEISKSPKQGHTRHELPLWTLKP